MRSLGGRGDWRIAVCLFAVNDLYIVDCLLILILAVVVLV